MNNETKHYCAPDVETIRCYVFQNNNVDACIAKLKSYPFIKRITKYDNRYKEYRMADFGYEIEFSERVEQYIIHMIAGIAGKYNIGDLP